MMSARPRVTAGGGTCCMPSALRKMEKTTANFTNEIDIMSRNGSSDRRASISTVVSGLPPHDVAAAASVTAIMRPLPAPPPLGRGRAPGAPPARGRPAGAAARPATARRRGGGGGRGGTSPRPRSRADGPLAVARRATAGRSAGRGRRGRGRRAGPQGPGAEATPPGPPPSSPSSGGRSSFGAGEDPDELDPQPISDDHDASLGEHAPLGAGVHHEAHGVAGAAAQAQQLTRAPAPELGEGDGEALGVHRDPELQLFRARGGGGPRA